MKSDKVLILIDVQKGFHDVYWGKRNNPEFEANITCLLDSWRKQSLPIIHIQHQSLEANSPLRPDRPGCQFMDFATPQEGETIIAKNVNSGFIGTQLESHLRQNNLTNLFLAGLTSDHCVSTTARMAANLGFKVSIIADATATFDRMTAGGKSIPAELVHEVSLASLHQEFAQVITTQHIML